VNFIGTQVVSIYVHLYFIFYMNYLVSFRRRRLKNILFPTLSHSHPLKPYPTALVALGKGLVSAKFRIHAPLVRNFGREFVF
jgi:hypothetical protein